MALFLWEILLSNYRIPKKVEKVEKRIFRFAFIRRKIQTIFKSRALKTALLAELYGGKDTALIAQMVEKVSPMVKPPVQAVAPFLHKVRRRRKRQQQHHQPTSTSASSTSCEASSASCPSSGS